jgi:hypothetical protein
VTKEAIVIKEEFYPTLQAALEQNPKMKKMKFVYPHIPVNSEHFLAAHEMVNPAPSTPRYSFKRNVHF